jgi:hypothetical protein
MGHLQELLGCESFLSSGVGECADCERSRGPGLPGHGVHSPALRALPLPPGVCTQYVLYCVQTAAACRWWCRSYPHS